MPDTINVEGTIKVHLPVLEAALRDRRVHVCPFNDEIDQRL
jgi:hypothetical protein